MRAEESLTKPRRIRPATLLLMYPCRMSPTAARWWIPWVAQLVWLGLAVLSFARHHFAIGGLLVAMVVARYWDRLLNAVVFGGAQATRIPKGHRGRVVVFTLVFFGGLMLVLRVLSPLWR